MSAHALQLEATHGEPVALQSVAIESTLVDLFAHTTLTQRFVNTENRPVEAVYTFPTAHGAVFTGLEVTIGDKRLVGVVMPDAKADRGYEEAIQDGNAAVLLREVEPGLYSVSVGNILPGETITLKYSYAEQLGWQGDTLRMTLPTTIAPRYGSPVAIGLEPHELIDHGFDAGYGCSLTVNVTGVLSHCAIASPSHSIATCARHNGTQVSLAKETASMDRDMVLTLTQRSALSTLGVVVPNLNARGVTSADNGKWVASVGFHLPTPKDAPTRVGTFNLIIDCSGSMGGDSIRQARLAAQEIVGSLQPEDMFNITAFGSHAENLFVEPVPVNVDTVEQACAFIANLGATYGGTEIDQAINTACPKRAGRSHNSNVLLITDGQVYDGDAIVKHHQHRGHRIFTLGVGTSVSAGFLQALAEGTGGACELVAPNEYMAQHIVRHFSRMRQLKVVEGEICWGSTPLWSVPGDIACVFAGDTLHVGAGFAHLPTGDVTLSVTYEDGSTQTFSAALKAVANDDPVAGALPRVLAHKRLRTLTQQRRLAMALDYQLLTKGTKCLMVHQRSDAEKTEDLPALRQVPHELPAGWGGTGMVTPPSRRMALNRASASMSAFSAPPRMDDSDLLDTECAPREPNERLEEGDFDIPAFLRRSPDYEGSSPEDSKRTALKQAKEKLAAVLKMPLGGAGANSLKALRISVALRAKLAGGNVHTVAELLAIPRAQWAAQLSLTDQEIAQLLNALRRAGYKAA